jgi:hypothetical protein
MRLLGKRKEQNLARALTPAGSSVAMIVGAAGLDGFGAQPSEEISATL